MAQALVPAAPGLIPAHVGLLRIPVVQTHYEYMPRRRLPHEYPEGKWLFVTCDLHGSLPQARYPPANKLISGEAFVWMDRYPDGTRKGPMYLKVESVARTVISCLYRGVDLGHYDLGSWVLMANHMHVLLFPRIGPSKLLRAFKGTSAREADRILNRTGEPFWQGESYDHWVRNDMELARIRGYTENNPVKAGLVLRPEDYLWSSASAGMSPAVLLNAHNGPFGLCAGGTSARATR